MYLNIISGSRTHGPECCCEASHQVSTKVPGDFNSGFLTLVRSKILVMTFRALDGQMPPHISELLQPQQTSGSLRSADLCLLAVPNPVLLRPWNSLPLDLRSVDLMPWFHYNYTVPSLLSSSG